MYFTTLIQNTLLKQRYKEEIQLIINNTSFSFMLNDVHVYRIETHCVVFFIPGKYSVLNLIWMLD